MKANAPRSARARHLWVTLLVGGLLLVSAPPLMAAKPATTAQKNAMSRAVPAAVAKHLPAASAAFRRCFSLDRSSARRSSVVRSYRFGFIRYNQRGSGSCAGEDNSYGFYAYFRTTKKGLRVAGSTNQPGCYSEMAVPLSVQREAFPSCTVF